MKKIALFGIVVALWGAGVSAQDVPKFPIIRFKIEGNSLLPQAQINAAVAPFLGKERDFGDVQGALEALEALYKQRGYGTATVLLPEQVLERGEVLLRVIEGRIKAVRISGQEHFGEDNIRASLPTLQAGEVPFIDDVSANLRIANENPAKKLTLQLKPGEHEEDIEADIRVTDEKPLKISTTLDNTGTAQTGKRRLGVSLQHANLWGRDHVMTFQYQTSPDKPKDVNVYALAYRMPLYGLGDALDVFATKSDVNAGTIAAGPIDLAISGRGASLGVRYTLNLKRRGEYEHAFVFGLDEKKYLNNINAGTLALGNELTVRPWSVQYNGRWQWEATELSFHGDVIHNIPGGEQGRQDDFTRARTGAPARFTVLRGDLSASHAYASDWQLRFNAVGQWTGKPLAPQEQFGIGGASSVRGFQEREIADDQGFQTTLELYSPEICQTLGAGHRCRALAFLDSGVVYRVDPLPGESTRQHVGSAGLGLRYTWDKHIAFQTDYGQVLQGGGSQQRGDWRLHVRLGVFF